MSIRVMSRVWDADRYAGGELLCLLALADWANDDGWAWPSIDRLAVKSRLSERQAIRVVAKLAREGALIVERGHGRGNTSRYRVVVGTPAAETKGDTVSPFDGGKHDTMSPVHETEKVTFATVKGDICGSANRKNRQEPSEKSKPSPTPPCKQGGESEKQKPRHEEKAHARAAPAERNRKTAPSPAHRRDGADRRGSAVPVCERPPGESGGSGGLGRGGRDVPRAGSGGAAGGGAGGASGLRRREQAVQRVMLACGFADRRLGLALVSAMVLGEREGESCEAIAERMIAGWQSYLEADEFLRFKWGPRKFFLQGHWRDDRGWPWDQQRLADDRRARVGM